MSVVEIEDGVYESTATIDNGSFGTRTIRFETGRLAKQAAGAVVAYLDDETMLLSATTASKTPKDHFDFFPLTIDVEERMYAAGRIPGSFFRREGRPSTDAILTCRLIDRPTAPICSGVPLAKVGTAEGLGASMPDYIGSLGRSCNMGSALGHRLIIPHPDSR